MNKEAAKKGYAQRVMSEIAGEEAKKVDFSYLNNLRKVPSRAELESAWHPVELISEEEEESVQPPEAIEDKV